MWDVGCGMWDVGSGKWEVGSGKWDYGCWSVHKEIDQSGIGRGIAIYRTQVALGADRCGRYRAMRFARGNEHRRQP